MNESHQPVLGIEKVADVDAAIDKVAERFEELRERASRSIGVSATNYATVGNELEAAAVRLHDAADAIERASHAYASIEADFEAANVTPPELAIGDDETYDIVRRFVRRRVGVPFELAELRGHLQKNDIAVPPSRELSDHFSQWR